MHLFIRNVLHQIGNCQGSRQFTRAKVMQMIKEIIAQSAYRAQHSTQTALHKVVDDWLYNITDGLHTTVCSFDIRKCFDTINHSIVRKWTSMVFMKMTLTYSGIICLIENKLLNVTMKYLKCVISTLVFRNDLF